MSSPRLQSPVTDSGEKSDPPGETESQIKKSENNLQEDERGQHQHIVSNLDHEIE